MQSYRHKQNMTERVRLVTSLQRSFYLSDYWQPGSGEGKAMLKTLSFQQFPVPEPSHSRSPGGNGAGFGSRLLTILSYVNIVLALIHQANALALIVLAIYFIHGLRAPNINRV